MGYFWSVTVYECDTMLLSANPLNCYWLGHGTNLAAGPGGSLTLHLQHEQPADTPLSSWRPAPHGPVVITMRLYGSSETITSGAWQPPGITRVG